MSSITRTVKLIGEKVEITFHRPTNEEYNKYSDRLQQVIESEDEAGLVSTRVGQFDQWVESIKGMDKADIYDRHKSSIMFQVFEQVSVDEKN